MLAEWDPIKPVEFSIGVFNGSGVGPGARIDDNNAKDIVGRVEVEPRKDLTFGFNASSHAVTQTIQNPLPAFAEKRFTAYGADVSCDVGNLKLIAEGLYADKPEIGGNTEMLGLYLTSVYKREVEALRACCNGAWWTP